MVVWMLWIQASDGATWLEAAWNDETTAENYSGWLEAVETARDTADANHGEMRIQRVLVPGVPDLFEIPQVAALVPEEEQG